MPSTKAYLAGLVALSVVATVFAALWFDAYIKYESYKAMYEFCKNKYTKLVDRYVKTLIGLGVNSGSDTLQPGYYLAFPIIIPIDDTGFVNVTVISKQSSVKVYIFDMSQFMEWCARQSFRSYYLHEEGAYIDSKVTLRTGVYFVVIINPNTTPTSIFYSVKTMYKSLYD
ncbi:MAG: hypothetical protein GU356_00530 [Pyrobaculum sp.]|jgi:hypothetical protein|nr:hypothetical protein [Pyrobaculum sp.]